MLIADADWTLFSPQLNNCVFPAAPICGGPCAVRSPEGMPSACLHFFTLLFCVQAAPLCRGVAGCSRGRQPTAMPSGAAPAGAGWPVLTGLRCMWCQVPPLLRQPWAQTRAGREPSTAHSGRLPCCALAALPAAVGRAG